MIDGKNIKPGAITNTNVNSSAGVELKKLEKGSSGQIVVTDSDGTQKYVTLSGDVTIDNDGVATVSSTISSSGTGSVGPQGPAGARATGAQGSSAAAVSLRGAGAPVLAQGVRLRQPVPGPAAREDRAQHRAGRGAQDPQAARAGV